MFSALLFNVSLFNIFIRKVFDKLLLSEYKKENLFTMFCDGFFNKLIVWLSHIVDGCSVGEISIKEFSQEDKWRRHINIKLVGEIVIV